MTQIDTTYTVLRADGAVEGEGLTTAEAADTILTYDSYTYSIRPEADGGFRLWTSDFSRASTAYNGESGALIWSFEADREAAETEIFRKILDHADWWKGQTVMTDDAYEAMLAELEADDDRAED